MDFASGIYLLQFWRTSSHIVTFKEGSKSCISHVFRRMGLGLNRCPGGSIHCGQMLRLSLSFSSELSHAVPRFGICPRDAWCSWEVPWVWCFLFGVFAPWWKLQNNTGFGTSPSFPARRRSLSFQYNMDSATAHRICPRLALWQGERGSSLAKGRG